MNPPVSNPSVVLQNDKDILIYQFRLIETLPIDQQNTVLNYLSLAWRLSTVHAQPLDPYNVKFRYTMHSAVTEEHYSFLIEMDPIQQIVLSTSFEGLSSSVAA